MALPDPLDSPDPAVRYIAERRAYLLEEINRLGRSLVAYAKNVPEVDSRPPVSLQDHYAFLDAPECGCATCRDWELRRAEFVTASKLVPKGHKWTICGCHACRFVGRIQLNYLAATNRRDLVIEMSFHARYHSRHGGLVMSWVEREMQNPVYTVNWCAQEMSRFPMERWLKRCEMAVSGVVSGAVFIDAAGVTEATSYMASTLNAEVDCEVAVD
jgi:hypothetical protein